MRVLNRILHLPRKQHAIKQISSIAVHRLAPNKSNIFVLLNRSYSSAKSNKENQLVENTTGEEKAVQTNVVENVKEATKTVSYFGIALVGFSITISVFYAIFSELFSGNSPNRIYSKAFDYISKDPRVQNVLGDQIKGFGEQTRRGRRQRVNHVEYVKDGMELMRMKFYVKGSRESGTVNLEMYKNEKGKYDYRYLFLTTDGMIRKTVILEDNRQKASAVAQGSVYPDLTAELQELDLSAK